jgi:hypothetical protein
MLAASGSTIISDSADEAAYDGDGNSSGVRGAMGLPIAEVDVGDNGGDMDRCDEISKTTGTPAADDDETDAAFGVCCADVL